MASSIAMETVTYPARPFSESSRGYPRSWQRAAVKTARPDEAERIDRVIGKGPNAPERATKFASAGAAASLARAASKRSLASDFDIDPKLVTERNSLGRSGYRGALNAAGDYRQLVGHARQDLSSSQDPEGLVQGRKTGALLGATNAFRVDHSAETAPPAGLKEAANFPVARVHEVARENARKGMFNANPPVAPVVEENKRQEQMRAAAVSMARAMLREGNVVQASFEQTAINERPLDLHNAAVKAAKQRVDKTDDLGAAMKEWYIPSEQSALKPHKSRPLPWKKFSPLHAVTQKREGEVNELDPERLAQRGAREHHMGQLQSIQRSRDRANLLAIAQKNVNKTMDILDEEVCVKTGKPSGALLADAEYREKRWAQLDARKHTPELVAIGGGKAVHTDEVEGLARDNVQPELEELDFGSETGDSMFDQRERVMSEASNVEKRGKKWLRRFSLKRKTPVGEDTDDEMAHGAGSVTGDSASASGSVPSTAETASNASRPSQGLTAPFRRKGFNFSKLLGRHRVPGTSHDIGLENAADDNDESTVGAAAGTSRAPTEDGSTTQGRRRLFSRRKTGMRKGKKLTVEDVSNNEDVGNEYLHRAPSPARAEGINEPEIPDDEEDIGVPSALRESRFHEDL